MTKQTLSFLNPPKGEPGDEWFTPEPYLALVRQAMGEIDLDPASCRPANALVQARRFYTKRQNGLIRPWAGTVYCNPPYSRGLVDLFSEKILIEWRRREISAMIVLTNNKTDTGWYQNLMGVANAWCHTRGRIKFNGQAGRPSPGGRFGQTFFYFGANPFTFAETFVVTGLVNVRVSSITLSPLALRIIPVQGFSQESLDREAVVDYHKTHGWAATQRRFNLTLFQLQGIVDTQ